MPTSSETPSAATMEARADLLEERVYITFTALAVVLALRSYDEPASRAATTLLIAVVGTLLAVFLADIVSHLAVHASLPTRGELRHMLASSFGALGAVALPAVFLVVALFDVWEVETALNASAFALVASLVAIGYLAVRRAQLPLRQRLASCWLSSAWAAWWSPSSSWPTAEPQGPGEPQRQPSSGASWLTTTSSTWAQ